MAIKCRMAFAKAVASLKAEGFHKMQFWGQQLAPLNG